MTNKEKELLQKKQLEILDEIKMLCDKHKIKYWLDGGTCLGAIRHKGFIPWDDDVDLGMPRKDFDRFIDVCKKELNNKFFLQTSETETNFPLEFAKIRMNYTLLKEKDNINQSYHQGIFIDIFPYDYTSNHLLIRYYLQYKTVFYRLMILHKVGIKVRPKNIIEKIGFVIINIISSLYSIKSLRKKLKKYYYKYPDTSKYMAVFVTTVITKAIYKKDLFDKTINIPFENKEYPVLANYDEFLTKLYGDYMTPPPVEKRKIGHGILEVKFKTKSKKGI